MTMILTLQGVQNHISHQKGKGKIMGLKLVPLLWVICC